TITVADFANLPPEDREFIADLDDSMGRNYERWKAERDKLGNDGGVHDGDVEKELTRIGRLICRDLNSILKFIHDMHKAELEDHYARYRFICQQLGAA